MTSPGLERWATGHEQTDCSHRVRPHKVSTSPNSYRGGTRRCTPELMSSISIGFRKSFDWDGLQHQALSQQVYCMQVILKQSSVRSQTLHSQMFHTSESPIHQGYSVWPHRNWRWHKHTEFGPSESLLRSQVICLPKQVTIFKPVSSKEDRSLKQTSFLIHFLTLAAKFGDIPSWDKVKNYSQFRPWGDSTHQQHRGSWTQKWWASFTDRKG